MDWGAGYGTRRTAPTSFVAQYHCQSTALAGKDVHEGDKIYLPPSALDKLARMNVEYPMLFEVISDESQKKTHCGVLEFSADEGFCYMPYWMMENLAIAESSLVTVKNVSLSKATFVKFRARNVDFLEVNNPRALLEVNLRKFTCLTVGDTIRITHMGKFFELDVREVQPNGAASIIETDCNVDFEEPLGYKDSKYAQHERAAAEPKPLVTAPRVLQKARVEEAPAQSAEAPQFVAFGGVAKRIDGKLTPSAAQEKQSGGDSKSAGGSKDTFKYESKSSVISESKAAAAETPAPAVTFTSSIGDKYSKKKIGVAAFAGAARKLA